ncbi:gamma-glutamylcyclotransferase [Oscillochloris sp. ZM17-4]|uniref:gamma-glutamylcyclotransferase family protein n=1 Tax=Oscillochloris sp. ZM17-4 TaxID=2866714 RepID=UPI001C730798|nr:gamma-glutamylcyclotransferase family protein [Oscillochloris sp. ZM17-4]MBX0326521.1 gamma-glutamylcyclotransferase [Oscillochloris sp. ZM17-4]
MNHPFFVYGTLKPGEPNYARFLAGHTVGEEPASLAGAALYTAGPYPYMVREPGLAAPDERVIGALISVADADYAAVMAQLDSLEGYAEDGAANMYERLLVMVETAGGQRPAWLYVAGAEALDHIRAGELRKVEGGNWLGDPESNTYWSRQ